MDRFGPLPPPIRKIHNITYGPNGPQPIAAGRLLPAPGRAPGGIEVVVLGSEWRLEPERPHM